MLEQSKVVFILEMVSKEVALAQVSLIRKAKLEQQGFGSLIGHINDRFNAMHPQFSKPIGQNGGHCFCHDALSPKSSMEFIACFGAMKIWVEVMETTRPDHAVFALACDTPADDLAAAIACMGIFDT